MPTASAFQQIVHSRLFALSVSDALARALHVSGDFPPLLGDVACDVIAQTDPDEPLPDFRAWLALSAAVEGRTEEAAAQLRAVDQLGQTDGLKLLLAMAEALVMVQQAGPAGKRQAFADAKEHLHTAADACAAKDVPPGAARWYHKVTERLASDAGTLPAKIWAWWQRALPWVKG